METIGTVKPPHPQPPSLDSPQEGFDAESIRLRFWIEGSKLKFKFFFFLSLLFSSLEFRVVIQRPKQLACGGRGRWYTTCMPQQLTLRINAVNSPKIHVELFAILVFRYSEIEIPRCLLILLNPTP